MLTSLFPSALSGVNIPASYHFSRQTFPSSLSSPSLSHDCNLCLQPLLQNICTVSAAAAVGLSPAIQSAAKCEGSTSRVATLFPPSPPGSLHNSKTPDCLSPRSACLMEQGIFSPLGTSSELSSHSCDGWWVSATTLKYPRIIDTSQYTHWNSDIK